jgi:1,4-alpha-glucan branching enzyme
VANSCTADVRNIGEGIMPKKAVARKPPKVRTPQKKRVQFTYEDPDANYVMVTGTFCDWKDGYNLKKDKKGLWKIALTLLPGRHEYRFVVDGEWREDPKCAERVQNPFGGENCVLRIT